MKSSWVKGIIKVLLKYEINKQYFDNLMSKKKETLNESFERK